MASAPSNRFLEELLAGFDWTSGTVKILLIDATSGHAFDPDVDVVTTLATFEATNTNYARGTTTGRAITRDDTNDLARATLDDFVFEDLGLDGEPAIGGAYLIRDLGSDATSWPIAWLENVAGAVNGLDWTASFDPLGIFRIRAAA